MNKRKQLEAAYKEANEELDDAFELINLDGLDDDEAMSTTYLTPHSGLVS